MDKSRIDYQIDELIEVFTRNHGWEAEGWWKAIIKNKKGNFFYVNYESCDKYDEIVEKNRLRPINTRETLRAGDYGQTQVTVSPELREWAQNVEEANQSLLEIRVKSGALIVAFDKERKHVIVVGKEENIETAKILLDVVLSHEMEVIQHCSGSNEEAEDEKAVETATVGERILSMLGGLEGEYFRQVKTRHKVDLELESEEPTEGKHRILITGDNMKTAQAARKEVQLGSMKISLNQKQSSYLRSRLAELQQKSKIVCTAEEEKAESVDMVAVGIEESLRNFKLAVETLLQFEISSRDLASEKEKVPAAVPVLVPVPETEAEEASKSAEDSYYEREYDAGRHYGRSGKTSYRRVTHGGPVRYIKKQV